jgi:hypothetical protein
MDAWSEVSFFLVAAGFLSLGVRNVLWTLPKEQSRFCSLVRTGLAKKLLLNGAWLVLFGGLIMFAARTVPHSVSWQVLGLAIEVLGVIGAAVGKFGTVATPSLEQLPADKVLLKRVRYRRLSGVLLTLGGIVWVLNRVPNAI